MDNEQETRARVATAFAAQRQEARVNAARLTTDELLSRLHRSPAGQTESHGEVAAMVDELAHRIDSKSIPTRKLKTLPHPKPPTGAVTIRPVAPHPKGGK